MLVCPAVFKTVAGGEELPRWVRFPHTLANGNRSGSAAPVFVHFNPSVSYAASSPAGEPFGIVQALPKSCPRLRGKCRGASRDERGNGSEMPSCFSIPPQSHFVRQLPRRRWRLLVQYKHGVQCRTPSRSDRFNGVTGVARGPKGRNRNLPWPPGKKGYKVACSAFCLFYSLRLLVSLASTSFDREAF